MAIHWVGCKLNGSHTGTTCRDESMNVLGVTDDCNPECALGEHSSGVPCYPSGTAAAPRRIETTRIEVTIPEFAIPEPRGPQPTTPGPLHAVVRGPGGLDVTVSADENLFGRILSAIGDAISLAAGD